MRVLRWLVLALGLVAILSTPVMAQDPFANVSSKIEANAKIWAGALVLLGALVAGGSIILGSQNSGKWVGRFIGGAVLLLLTVKGKALIDWLSTSFGIQ